MKYYHFKDAIILHVSGKDSQRYLNARLTNDIKILKTGESCFAAALNPQGKTEGIFRVVKDKEDSFYLFCDAGNSEEVIASFKRYLVADRVIVNNVSDQFRLLHLSSQLNFKLPYLFLFLRKIISAQGTDLILSSQQEEEAKNILKLNAVSELDFNEYTYNRILNNHPSFPEEMNNTSFFYESGLLEYVSFKKGCYAGQEVIEKIDSHGRLAKKLARVRFESTEKFDQKSKITLASDDTEVIGKIVSSASMNDTLAFASIDSEIESGTRVICNKIPGELF